MGKKKEKNPFSSYQSIFSSKFITFLPEVQNIAVGSVFFNGKWVEGNSCFSNISSLSRIDLFFFPFVNKMFGWKLSGEMECALQGWGASLLHEGNWQHWMVQMICLPYPAGPGCTVSRGRENEQKKCYFIQCELKNKESVNWSGNKELGIRSKLQRNQWVKKPHINFSSTANQRTKLECWVPADVSPVAPNEKSTWPCFGTFTADVKAWNSTWGWRSDKASWLQYLWGWRARCTRREEQLAFFISPVAGWPGRLWKSIQMPPSIKRDKARPPGEVNTESFICLCILLESLLLLQCRSPSLQAEQSAASLGESWGSWNIDTSQAGS